jgi:hypothetical protein
MTEESSRPAQIEGIGSNPKAPWQQQKDSIWSFGPTGRLLFSSMDPPRGPQVSGSSANEAAPSATRPSTADRQDATPPVIRTVGFHNPSFGKRSFRVLSQWEGEVEKVSETGFRARLLQVPNGHRSSSRFEFTEFSFEDLANEDDRALVQSGAVFYWTIGRSRNVAGTNSNVSLVRFRRLPPPGRHERRRARTEAQELLRDDDAKPNGPNKAGS